MNIKIYVDKRQHNSNGSCNVYFRVTADDKTRFLVSTGMTTYHDIIDGEFDKAETRAELKTRSLKIKMSECYAYADKHPYMPSHELKKGLIETLTGMPVIAKKAEKPLSVYFDEYIYNKVENEGTKKLYAQSKNVVMAYDKDASFSSVTPEWLDNLYRERIKMGKKINGIARTLRDIRAVFNYCRKKGYTTLYPFVDYKIPSEKTTHRNLNVQTIRDFVAYPCEEFQEKYRDVFMLSLYLWGINIGDLLLLTKDDFQNGYIYYSRQKTGKPYQIKVEPEAEAIINKYRGKKYLLCFMDKLTDYHTFLQHCNKALKSIGKTYSSGKTTTGEGLIPQISTYYARHSVATLAAEIGISMNTISMGLGHTMSGGASVTSTYVEFQQWMIDDAMREIIDYIHSDKDQRSYMRDKKIKDIGMEDIIKYLQSQMA